MKIFSNFVVISVLILGLSSCGKEGQPNYEGIEIYGHGGIGFETFINRVPANSFESIQKAIEILNADGVEVDIQIDNNGKLWLFHDQFVDAKTNGTGCFGNLNSSEITQLSYVGNRPIYSLDELIQYASTMDPQPKISLQAQVFNRCKSYQELGNAIYKTIHDYNAYHFIQVESDSGELLALLKDSSNLITLYIDEVNIESGIKVCVTYGFQGVIASNNDVSIQEITRIHDLGLKIGLYGVETEAQAKDALAKFPDQIQTDNISLINRIVYQ